MVPTCQLPYLFLYICYKVIHIRIYNCNTQTLFGKLEALNAQFIFMQSCILKEQTRIAYAKC